MLTGIHVLLTCKLCKGRAAECHLCYTLRKRLLSIRPESLTPQQVYGIEAEYLARRGATIVHELGAKCRRRFSLQNLTAAYGM